MFVKACITLIFSYHVRSIIESSSNLSPFSFSYDVWDISGSHMVAISSVLGDLEFYDFSTKFRTTYPLIHYLGVNRILTHISNTNQSYCMAIYTLSGMNYISKNKFSCRNSTSMSLLSKPVLTSIFGITTDQLYESQQNTGTSSLLTWHKNQVKYNATYTNNHICKYQTYLGTSIFYVFLNVATNTSSALVIYSVAFAGNPTFYNHYQYVNCPTMKIDARFNSVAVNCGDRVDIRIADAPYTSVLNISLNFIANQIAIVSPKSFVVKSSNGLIAQYSTQDGSLMDIKNFALTSANHMKYVGNNQIFLFGSGPSGLIFKINQNVRCQGPCNCPLGYTQINNNCIMNENILNNSNTTTTPSNNSSSNSSTSSSQSTNQNGSNIMGISRQNIRFGSIAIGNSLSLASIRFIAKSNVPLSLFMEEFVLYKYYKFVQYSDIMKIFIQEFQVINLLKLKPSFMAYFQFNYTIGNSAVYRSLYTNNYNSYEPLYFFQSTKQFCTCIILNCMIFLIFKLLDFVLNMLKPKFSNIILKRAANLFSQKSQWWALFMMIIEAEYTLLCFYCLNQVTLCFWYSFQNKCNYLVALVLFFIIFTYGIIGYPLMNRYCKKFSVKLLILSKYEYRSLWLQNGLLLSFKLFKSFAHCILIICTPFKFFFLSCIDLACISFFITYKRQFYSQTFFIIYLLYQFGVLFINILLGLKLTVIPENQSQIIYSIDYLMITLFLLTIIKFLIGLAKQFKEIYRSWINNNIKPIRVQERNLCMQKQGSSSRRETKHSNINGQNHNTEDQALNKKVNKLIKKPPNIIPQSNIKKHMVLRVKTIFKQKKPPKKSNFAAQKQKV